MGEIGEMLWLQNSKTGNTGSRAAAPATKGVTDLHSDGGSFHLNAVKRRR